MVTNPDTEELLNRVERGDAAAREELLARHRDRLRQMVALRLDRRLAPRVDPSDVVQEALAEAAVKLPDYARSRPLPYYPWLRQIAWERLVKLQRAHLKTKKRSVALEEFRLPTLPGESAIALADRLLAMNSSPSRRLVREELGERVREALATLTERDRELLLLRYVEHLSMAEIAAVLGCTEGAAKVRHLRALERLRGVLDAEEEP